jgi:hypothetical protein
MRPEKLAIAIVRGKNIGAIKIIAMGAYAHGIGK